MTWARREPAGADQLMDYESEVNRFAPLFPQVLLCLYDLAQFGGGIILDLVRTHPKVLLGGGLIDNPNFLTPDEYRATRSCPSPRALPPRSLSLTTSSYAISCRASKGFSSWRCS